jgi:hypothetical protein
MTIKQLKKDIEEIKHHLNGQIPNKSQRLNQLSYQISRIVTDNYPKYGEAIGDIGDYLAITPGLEESFDEDGNIKLDGKFNSDSPEVIHYKKFRIILSKSSLSLYLDSFI